MITQRRGGGWRPETFNKNDRSVEGVIATEDVVRVFDLSSMREIDEVLRLDGVALPNSIPLLDTHDSRSVRNVLGSTRGLRVDDGRLVGRNFFAADDEDAERALAKVRDGHLTDFSVGYEIREWETVRRGERAEIGGMEYEAAPDSDLRVVTRWALLENSICPVGADRAAKVRAAARKEDEMEEHVEAAPSERQDKREMTPEERELWDEAYAAGRAAASEDEKPEDDDEEEEEMRAEETKPSDDTRAREEFLKREKDRINQIRKEGAGISTVLVDRAVIEGWTVSQARKAFLEELRASKPLTSAFAVHTTQTTGMSTIGDALMMRAGVMRRTKAAPGQLPGSEEPEEQFNRRCEQAHRLAAKPIYDLLRMGLGLVGEKRASEHGVNETVRAALMSTRSDPITTLSLPNLFANLLNKAVMVGFMELDDSTFWCNTSPIADYKSVSRLRLGAFPDLTEVPLGGDIEDGDLGEDNESYVLKRYAKKIVLDEMYLINDDLNQFAQLARMLGSAARRLRPDLVYAHLLANGNLSDSIALFHATSHGANLGTGTLGDANLAAGVAIMFGQTGKQGEQLAIQPRYLIVPQQLRHTARKLVNSQEILKVGDDESYYGTYNPHRDDGFMVVTEPRLSNSAFDATNYSLTAWYLAADPSLAPTIEVGVLRGQETPRVVEVEAGTSIRRKWEVVWSCGVKALDYRGLYKSSGTV